jgi:glycosyltransferase involved in cell wall biosynthesis
MLPRLCKRMSSQQRVRGLGRILVSAHTYQPDGVSEGWAAAQLVAALRRRGRRMTVFTAAIPRLKKAYGIVGIQCKTETDIPYVSPLNYAEFALRSVILGRRVRERISVVHHVSPMVIRLPSILGALGRPFIWGPVGGSIPYPEGFERYGRRFSVVNAVRLLDRPRMQLDPTMRFTMNRADRIVVTTSMAAELIPRRYRSKTIVIPEGIPESLVLPAAPREDSYIFSSGRLIDYKAMDLLIRAFAIAKSTDVKLIISGDGPNKADLYALIDRLRVSKRVELLGRVPRTTNYELMSRSLFCVFPALREAFGHGNLEAMAAWKPVIATDWGGPRDLIENGVSGIKVLGRDPEEHVELIAAAIDRLIGDRELRRRMGAAAAVRAKTKYTWSVLAGHYDELYSAVSL